MIIGRRGGPGRPGPVASGRAGYTVAMLMRLPESGSLTVAFPGGLGHAAGDGTGLAFDGPSGWARP